MDIPVPSRKPYVLGIVLIVVAILTGVGALIGECAILFYVGPIGSRAVRQLFSAVSSVVGLFVAGMCMIYTRRLLKRLFGS